MNPLQRHFDACRLPVEFVNERPSRPRVSRISALNFNTGTPAPSADNFFYVDVAKEKRAERFRLYVHPDAEVYLREKRPAARHMMLQIRCFPKQDDQPEVRNLLLGHDERQLFVMASQSTDRIEEALARLKPFQAYRAEHRGRKVIRQGDWFFIPMPRDFELPTTGIPAHGETIGGANAHSRGILVGNPHIAEEQMLVPPLMRYFPNNPTRGYVARNAFIVVRGKIRHSEHSTVELRGWHQPIQNTAVQDMMWRQLLRELPVTEPHPNSLIPPSSIGYYD